MDQDAGVQLVDTNPDDIEILQILASGPSTTIHRYTSYDINGYTFYTRAQDNKRTNQNNGVRTDAYDCDGNKTNYYGFIEEIRELKYRENLKVPLFRCQWIKLPNGVKTDKYGMTNVNFRFLGYREQPFVLAKDVTQVFYVKDPDLANRDEHHIILQGKRKKLLLLKMSLMRKSTTSLTLYLHLAKISLSLQFMTSRNLHTYVVITMKLSLLDEVI
jgi:hypothetical protein